MASNTLGDPPTAFRLTRPLITSNGFGLDPDTRITAQLIELSALLDKRVFAAGKGNSNDDDEDCDNGHSTITTAKQRKSGSGSSSQNVIGLDPKVVLKAPLTPRHAVANDGWADHSLGDRLSDAAEKDELLTLADYVDRTPKLSALAAEVDEQLRDDWLNLPEKAKALLDDDYAPIRRYLVAFGYLVKDLKDVSGIKSFIFNGRQGLAAVGDYAIVGAARTLILDKALNVPGYDDDPSEIVAAIKKANLSLSSITFEKAVLKVVDDRIFSVDQLGLINGSKFKTLDDGLKFKLVPYMKSSPVKLDAGNVDLFLPLFINQIAGQQVSETPTPVSQEEADKDFDVDFVDDDGEQIQVSRSAVKCAAQLYYSMVVGDELDVFGVIHYFTHKYLVRGGIEITDARLRDDLKDYVFSNRFTDLGTGEVVERTRPAERQMFFRQVFDAGAGQVTEDLIVNDEFPRLWKVLMLESAQYLERAQQSPHPDSFVSRQQVMQAVEDVQYNLSTHCTGMANVISPLIDAELSFVIRRILKHPEVLRQVVPSGGTWWRVVERLYMECRHARPKATALYNKAKLGYGIIASIADYNPATFQTDDDFSAFISKVDAFITTQSILQEALTDDLKREQEDHSGYEERGSAGPLMPAGAPASSNGKSPADEWDF